MDFRALYQSENLYNHGIPLQAQWDTTSFLFPAFASMTQLSVSDFLGTAPGRALLGWESVQFDEMVQDAFGFEALQVGCPRLDTLKANRIVSHWLTDADADALTGIGLRDDLQRVQAESGWLPFASESLDLVTLPHTLDFAESPHQTLREAARVLVPEGRLILTAFNPLSLWWLRQRSVSLGLRPYLPSKTVPISLYRLKDWLQLLGFEIDRGRFGLYEPPCRTASGLARWKWMNKAGDRWAPHCANLVMLSAVKRLPGTTLVGRVPIRRAAGAFAAGPAVSVSREAR